MTAHLAMASALSSSQSAGYGLSGRYADILRQIMECRAASALARLDAIEASGMSSDPQATWNRVLRMRATLDWRVSMNVHRDSLLERLEFFRIRTATIPSQSVVNALTDDDLSSQADWGRLTLHNDFDVETGNRVMPGLLSRELREINDVERGTPDAPTKAQTLGAALNNGTNGCITSTGVHIIGWGTWSRFFQRHLANYVYRVDNYYRYYQGLPEEADSSKAELDRTLGDLDLYPVASCWRQKGPHHQEKADYSRLADAIALTIRAPDLITAQNWSHLQRGMRFQNVPVGMPPAASWFMPASAARMPFDAGRRTVLARPALSAAETEAILAVSPYDITLAHAYVNAQAHQTPKDSFDRQRC